MGLLAIYRFHRVDPGFTVTREVARLGSGAPMDDFGRYFCAIQPNALGGARVVAVDVA